MPRPTLASPDGIDPDPAEKQGLKIEISQFNDDQLP